MKSIQGLADEAGKSVRTIQRWVVAYNEENKTEHKSGTRDLISDEDLIFYIESKYDLPPGVSSDTEPVVMQEEKIVRRKNRKTTLQDRLSADWLVILVLFVILFADMFAFGTIGNHNFGTKIKYSAVIFSIIGLATGVGSVITYNRIKNFPLP